MLKSEGLAHLLLAVSDTVAEVCALWIARHFSAELFHRIKAGSALPSAGQSLFSGMHYLRQLTDI